MFKTIAWFDLETTGTNKATDRIVQMSIIKTLGLYEVIDKKKFLCNPQIPIPQGASDTHGITDEMVVNLLPFSAFAQVVHQYMSDCDIFGGFNIKQFDIPLLAEEFARCGLEMIEKPVIDSSVIFKKWEKRTLEAALFFYTGKDLEGAHDAENDVLATIEVAIGQVLHYGFDKFYNTNVSLNDIENNLVSPIDIEDTLIEESKYEDEKPIFDYHNRIILNEQDIPIWNFGKHKDKNIPVKQDIGYANWCLGLSDFPETTKNLIKKILNG